MPKLSRPVVYTFVAAVAAYAAVLLTQPDAPAPRRVIHVLTVARPATDPDAITAADLSAHFARYAAGKRDPFVPKVVPVKAGTGPAGAGGTRDVWALTGIYTIDDSLNALVENRTTGDSVSLKRGDRWRGLRVLAIGSDAVVFENALGQHTKIAFAAPVNEEARPNALGRAARLPALRVVGPLRPMPIIGPLPPLSPTPPMSRSH